MPPTYEDARDLFLDRAALRERTKDIYAQAVGHFLDYVEAIATPPLSQLGPADAGVLEQFALWLRGECDAVNAASTTRTYASGVSRWFRWLADYGHLPTLFPLDKARRLLREALSNSLFRSGTRPPEPLPDEVVDLLITYYDTLTVPDRLKNPTPRARWLLENIRNRALMRVLAETGGRVSEVLSLDAADFPPRAFALDEGEVWRVWVDGKGEHGYYLRFSASLPYIRDYLQARRADGTHEAAPLFVNHTPSGKGTRMSRNAIWRIVNGAAKATGVGRVCVHDFRHWCASFLVRQGVQMEIIKEYLGHQSLATTERYYAHISQAQVDEAALRLL